MAMPGMNKPTDILAILADPEKFKETAEKLQFLKDEAETKLEMLRTKNDVEQYVKDRRKEIDKLVAKAALDQKKAAEELKQAEEKHNEASEHLEFSSVGRKELEADQSAWERKKAKFNTQYEEKTRRMAKAEETLSTKTEKLREREILVAKRIEFIDNIAKEIHNMLQKIKELPIN